MQVRYQAALRPGKMKSSSPYLLFAACEANFRPNKGGKYIKVLQKFPDRFHFLNYWFGRVKILSCSGIVYAPFCFVTGVFSAFTACPGAGV
jgi:hypothetical protein